MRKVEEIMQVNSLNQRIGKIPIDKMSKEIYFRTCNMFIFDKNNKIYVQQRSATENPFPGFWDAAPGGVVRISETDFEAVMREISEEMGIKPVEVAKIATVSIENEGWFYWTTFFKGKSDELVTKSKEVEQYVLMEFEEIKEKIKNGEKFTPWTKNGLYLIENQTK